MKRKTKRPAAASHKKSTPKKSTAKGGGKPATARKSTASKPSTKTAAVKPAANKAQFFFPGPAFDPLIVSSRPKPFAGIVECDTFEEAKHQALDALIEIIDRCEQRLWELKRSASYDDYRRLSSSPG